MMWIPYIIFHNTDDDEAVKIDALTEDGKMRTKVSVKRENDFTRSGPEVADEVFSFFYYLKPNLKLLLSRLRFSKEKRTLLL